MKAYKVMLQLWEKDDAQDEISEGSVVEIFTVANSLADASALAVQLYEKADAPTDGFHWEALYAEELKGRVALRPMREVLPKT